ncbi:MAG: hypothetical protein H7842_12835 [Gammaproteobacteria bacterium SHHR-1]
MYLTTESLAEQAQQNISSYGISIDLDLARWVITEALFCAHTALLNGQGVDLDYLGQIKRLELPGGPLLHYRADDSLYSSQEAPR